MMDDGKGKMEGEGRETEIAVRDCCQVTQNRRVKELLPARVVPDNLRQKPHFALSFIYQQENCLVWENQSPKGPPIRK